MTYQSFDQWLQSLKTAWVSRDATLAASICAEDVEYFEHPFEPPINKKGVFEEWQQVETSQKDVSFDYEIISVTNHKGVSIWSASYTDISSKKPIELSGVFIVELDKNGLCKVFRQWWVVKDA